jgi:SAM-dependent methyltransferase
MDAMAQAVDPSRAASAAPEGVSPAFWRLVTAEPLAAASVLDVGTGRGRIALALAPLCARVVGIDRDAAAIADARARAAGVASAEFVVADAEAGEYAAWAPDLVVAHLCMSDAIAERAGRALAPERALAFVAFHADHWRETGRRSRFAYDEAQAADALARAGFAVEHLSVDRSVESFGSVEAALAAVVGLEERWRVDGRWFNYVRYLEDGGRTLTRSFLIGLGRRR